MPHTATSRTSALQLPPEKQIFIEELTSHSRLIRHIALCRLLLGEKQPQGIDRRVIINEALERIGTEPKLYPSCLEVLLTTELELMDLIAANERQRANYRSRSPQWLSTDLEYEALNLQWTINHCLREHGWRLYY